MRRSGCQRPACGALLFLKHPLNHPLKQHRGLAAGSRCDLQARPPGAGLHGGDGGFKPINPISLKADAVRTLRREGLPGITPVALGNAVSIDGPDPEGNRLAL